MASSGYGTVSILRVPSDTKRRALLLPVPARSDIGSYGTTGTSLMRRTRSITSPRAPAFIPICPRCRCRGNRHGPQLAAPARLIERPVRSPWGSVARSLSRTCFRDKYPPYGSSFPFVLCFTLRSTYGQWTCATTCSQNIHTPNRVSLMGWEGGKQRTRGNDEP